MATKLQSALARLAADTKKVCTTSADVIKTAKPGARAAVTGSKAAIFTHSIFLAATSGVILGVFACHLVNKYRLSKKEDTVEA